MSQRFSEHLRNINNKAHAFPPFELYKPLELERIKAAWSDFASRDADKPFGVYVHIPFCERKCTFCYCDTIITDDADRVAQYLEALHKEIDLFAPVLGGRKLDTLYLGGGTPTWISAPQLDELLGHLLQAFPPSDDLHLNIEGTPYSIDENKAAVLKKYGTTRVTLGIQSLDENILAAVNRPQTMNDVERSVALCRDAGVSVINFDLVGGLTNDTEATFSANFERLLELKPDMVHVYPYSARPGLPLSPDKESILRASEQALLEHGYSSIKNDGWGLHPDAVNLQVIHKIEHAASCLGLGIRARSHIFNRLAYRSHFTSDYVTSLKENGTPSYRGTPMTKKLQVQKYLMDNMAQGLSRTRFTDLFGGDPLELIRARWPHIADHVVVADDEHIALDQDHRRGHWINEALMEPSMEAKLFSEFVGQPKGWPESQMQQADVAYEPDLNFAAFCSIKLSKGNTYPPIAGDQPIVHQQVMDAWKQWAARVKKGQGNPVLGVYIHVPFCATICKFCYCYKNLLDKPDTLERYVDALIDQIETLKPTFDGIAISSLYMGGGTPSLLQPEQLDRLLTAVNDAFIREDSFQFNFEGTPQTLARTGRLEVLAKHGCNRLTVGIQSLERDLLQDMDRAQGGPGTVEQVFLNAREVGIPYINADLLAGLPGQSVDHFKRSLDLLVSWKPDVLHPYPFQATEETVYWKEGYRVNQEDEDNRGQMMDYARTVLDREGYEQVPFDSWALSIDARNKQDVDKIIHASSVLPLGYNARGHVFEELAYGVTETGFQAYMEDRSQTDFYYGLPVTREDDMIRFVISNLRTGIDRIVFHDKFKQDVLDVFWPQFWWLQKQGLVRVSRTWIDSKMGSSQNSVLYSKLFFANKYDEKLRLQFSQEYDSEVDWVGRWQSMYEQSF
ncbi:MAG: coproporphyrinogen-III oxidase family protein [Myxococcota bacterium]